MRGEPMNGRNSVIGFIIDVSTLKRATATRIFDGTAMNRNLLIGT
jgi:hypothetical protein